MCVWVYIQTEPRLWTVGFYAEDGTWHTDSDHDSRDAARAQVHFLNSIAVERDTVEHYAKSFQSGYRKGYDDGLRRAVKIATGADTHMHYRGYTGSNNFSAEDNVYHGKIQNVQDLVTYEASTESDLEISFREAVDAYIDYRKVLGLAERKQNEDK